MKNDLINKIKNIQDKEVLNKINLYIDTLTSINKKTINDLYFERINSNLYTKEQKQQLEIVYKECLEQQRPYIEKIKKLKQNDLILKLIINDIREDIEKENINS